MGGTGKSASDRVLGALWGLVAWCLWLCVVSSIFAGYLKRVVGKVAMWSWAGT